MTEPTGEDRAAALAAIENLFTEIAGHDNHAWQQVGRCVYCHDCNQRLYQGKIPSDHTKVYRKASSTPKANRDMRTRWGMD
jgi:hypothetical protein